MSALDDAVRTHGAGDQAHRIAYLALKQKFEKRGDHWIAKDNPADCGGAGQPVSLLPAGRAAGSRSSGRRRSRRRDPSAQPPLCTTRRDDACRLRKCAIKNHPVPGVWARQPGKLGGCERRYCKPCVGTALEAQRALTVASVALSAG